jgi:prepilin peptidase CpaA
MIYLLSVVGFTGTAATWDWRWRRIPNWLTVSAAICGLAFHLTTAGWAGLGKSLAGFAVGFALLLVLWIIGGGGAGDVKFMAALGAWLGPVPIVIVFVLSAALVLLLGCLKLAGRLFRLAATETVPAASPRSLENARGWAIPYAIPATLATWLLVAWSIWRAWVH